MKIRPSIYSILLAFIASIILTSASELDFNSVAQAQAPRSAMLLAWN